MAPVSIATIYAILFHLLNASAKKKVIIVERFLQTVSCPLDCSTVPFGGGEAAHATYTRGMSFDALGDIKSNAAGPLRAPPSK